MNGKAENTTTFWDHLDELRRCLIRIIMITIAMGALAFCMKDTLFDIVLAPHNSNFVTYRLLDTEPFTLHLMNTGLTEQFMIHMKTALYAGLLLSSPYVLYVLFGFVAPALYENERRIAIKITMSAYVMFILGTLLNYFLIFPLTVHFLGTYQVSTDVDNMLTLQSYMDTLITMCLVIGVMFELPIVSWLLARMGIINGRMMTLYRRHAIVAIVIVAAIITPTTDVFTLFVVSMPIWLLYELSILIVRMTGNNQQIHR